MIDCTFTVASILKSNKFSQNQSPQNALKNKQIKNIPYALKNKQMKNIPYASVCLGLYNT